uniref:Uncharacterized protein n=1 Tax=Arundo donax TaxID=35708 RepID=A0A0A9GF97_ARUDO
MAWKCRLQSVADWMMTLLFKASSRVQRRPAFPNGLPGSTFISIATGTGRLSSIGGTIVPNFFTSPKRFVLPLLFVC